MKQIQLTGKRHVLDPAAWRDFCHEAMPAEGAGEVPLKVTGWSRRGIWTRIEALYPNGGRLSLQLNSVGVVTDCTAFRTDDHG